MLSYNGNASWTQNIVESNHGQQILEDSPCGLNLGGITTFLCIMYFVIGGKDCIKNDKFLKFQIGNLKNS